jgi:GxxExxY protein
MEVHMPQYETWLQNVKDAAEEVLANLGTIDYDERVYEEALCHELRIRDIAYERQRNFELMYKGYTVGSGRVDFIINPFWATKKHDEHVMEIKAVKRIQKSHIRQALVYMISLDILTGAVMSFHHEAGILIEPLEMPKIKPRDRAVKKLRSKKTVKKEVLKRADNEVFTYFGTEFIYRETTGLETYEKAVGVELRLNGIHYNSAVYPILYKYQQIDELALPFAFADNAAMVLEIYKKSEEIETYKNYYGYYANRFGIKKLYIALIPEKEEEKLIFVEI